MAEVAQKYRDQFVRIKKSIEKSSLCFKANNERFHEFTKFVFSTNLSNDDESTLKALGKPVVEFNFVNSFVSRLCGEFSKQEPSIVVMAENGVPIDPQTLEVVEGHLRHILFESKKHNTQYNVYKDQLSGGFSSFKIYTEYAHEMSFDQVIRFGRVYEPTLVGYDASAREVSKCDSEYSFELFPMPKDRFKAEYPNVDISDLSYTKEYSGFAWSYSTDRDDIVVLCDYYEKKYKKKKIVKLADNRVMTIEKYEEFLKKWEEQGFTEQPPAIVGKPRWTVTQVICRYLLIGTQVLEYEETDFKYLPHIFVDGDSAIIKDNENGNFHQFTKPYIFHAKGIQRLANFSGQVIANDFENMVMHKFKVAKESLPQEEEYLEAYKNVQQASVLVYQAFMDSDPDKPVPAPQEIVRVGLPSEVVSTFNTAIQITQNILGSYDASLGINDNQLSGTAIVEAATQSNSAAMPYVVSHMQSLNHAANVMLDLIPKYYVTPRTIPIMSRDGQRSYVKINQPGGVSFNYDENVLSCKVEVGPSFAVAKSKALNQIILLTQASPLFAQFMAERGLPFILDNMEFKGSDLLAEQAKEWMQQMEKARQQQANQPNPMMLQEMNEKLRIQQKQQEVQMDAQLKAAQLQLDKQKIDNERLNMLVKSGESRDKIEIAMTKAQAEEARAKADLGMKTRDMAHAHAREIATHALEKEKFKHEKSQSENKNAFKEIEK